MQFENELFGLVQVQVQAEDPTLPRSHKRLLQRLLQAGSSCAAGGRRVQQQQVLQWQEEPGQEPLGSIPGAELAIVEPANQAHSPACKAPKCQTVQQRRDRRLPAATLMTRYHLLFRYHLLLPRTALLTWTRIS